MTETNGKTKKILKILKTLLITVAAVLMLSCLRSYLDGYCRKDDIPAQKFLVENSDYLQVHIIDIGQGDSILVRTSGGDVLIDTGPGSAENDLRDYLGELEVDDFEYVVFTHPDADHIGNADMIMTDYTVSNVILPDRESSSGTYVRMAEAIEESGANVIYPVPQTVYTLGSVTFTVLAPISAYYPDNNDYSVVLRVDFGETSFMMTGDAEKISEGEMLERYDGKLLDCDVLKVGHHGSSSSTTEEFLSAVSPDIALISCGRGNSYGHPCADVLQKLERQSAKVYRTDEDGSIVISSDGENIEISLHN